MNKAESDRIHELCAAIAVEQDQAKFLRLLTELNQLLSSTELPSKAESPNEGKSD